VKNTAHLVLVILAILAQSLAFASADNGAQTQSGSGRLQFVRSLIEESSAARLVAASPNAQAKAKQQLARELHRQAVAASHSGDQKKTEDLLTQAAKEMFEAVKLAEQDRGGENKKQREFDGRLASVEALSGAYDRICDEKKCESSERTEVKKSVDGRLRQARSLREQGNIDQARLTLDEAYVAIKVAIEHQRSGDTLVRSLQFKNKEEEYRYEVDRNDTHRMLIKLLLDDKSRGPPSTSTQKLLDAAATLRAQAEKEAAQGKYETAIQGLESSTRELQRALRGAGIYIPG